MTRCFISLDLPAESIEEIKKIQAEIQNKNLFQGKFTESENLHLTLKFLGEIDDNKIVEVKKRLLTVKERLRKEQEKNKEKSNLQKIPFFEAHLTSLGVFSQEQIRIIWLQMVNVHSLQKAIDHALQDLFPTEERFMGHITIARVKKILDKEKLLKTLKNTNLEALQKQKININKFFLKKSVLTATGSLYAVIEGYNL